MANTTIALKKSGTTSSKPVSLANGEIAINYADGVLYYKHSNGNIASISAFSGNYFGTVDAGGTLLVSDTQGDIVSIYPGDGVTIVGDAINDRMYVNASPIGASANGWANTVSVADRATSNSAANSANAYAVTVGAASNTWANATFYTAANGTIAFTAANGAYINANNAANSANAYAVTVGAAANTWANTKLTNGTVTLAGSLTTTGSITSNSYVYITAIDGTGNEGGEIQLSGAGNYTGWSLDAYQNNYRVFARTGSTVSNVNFFHAQVGGSIRMGVNKTDPAYTVDVSGDVNITGTYRVNGTPISSGGGMDYAYANGVANSANAYAVTVGAAANVTHYVYANGVANSANAYAVTVGAASNTWANTTFYTAANGTIAFTAANGAYINANNAANSANAYAVTVGAAANVTHYVYANGVANSVNSYTSATYFLKAGGTISGDVAITGNLTLLGNATSIRSNNLVVGDSMIYLAANNYSGTDIVDIGFVANYGNATSANVHTGLLRDSTTKQYYLFQGLDIELDANNTAFVPYANNMTNAALNADLVTSNLNLGGANAITWINSLYPYANGTANSANAYAVTVGAAANVTHYAYANGVANSANIYGMSYGNSAFTTIANGAAAFTAANGAYINANNAANSANIYGMSYGNSSFTTIANGASAFLAANGSYINANNAANSANAYAVTVGAAANVTHYVYANSTANSANAYAVTVGAAANVTHYVYANGVANSVNIYTAATYTANTVSTRFLGTANNADLLDGFHANAFFSNTSGVTFAGNLFIPAGSTLGIGSTEVAAPLTISLNNTTSVALSGVIIDVDGSSNTFLQNHIRNANTQQGASSDWIATTDDGTDSTNYIDLGINNSGFSSPTWTINGNRDGYLYTSDSNLAIGTANSTVAKSLVFFVGGTLSGNEAMRITPTKNIAIGRTTAGYALDVVGSVNASALLVNGAAISGGGVTIGAESSSASTFYPVFTLTTSGTMSSANVDSTDLKYVPSTGTFSSLIFNTTSDITMKTDIEEFDGYELIRLIDPVGFRWKRTGMKSYGVIAQDLEKVLPELVQTDDEGIKSVSYIPMIAMLIDVVKKQQIEIEKIKKLLNKEKE